MPNAIALQNAFLQGDGEQDHLSYEQFALYVDGETDEIEREIVDVHKKVCRECAVQLDEMFKLRKILNFSDNKVVSAEFVEIEAASAKSSLSDLWNRIWAHSALKIAFPAMASVLFGVLIWAIWTIVKTPRTEIAEVAEPEKASAEDTEALKAAAAADGSHASSAAAPVAIAGARSARK